MVKLGILLFALIKKLALDFNKSSVVPLKIVVVAPLLIGDTLMSVPLLARIRHAHPTALIFFLVRGPLIPLFEIAPYGVIPLKFSNKKFSELKSIRAYGPFDIGFALGENRYAVLAKAIGCKKVVALAHGEPRWRNIFIDQAVWPISKSTNIYEWQSLLQKCEKNIYYVDGEFDSLKKHGNKISLDRYILIHVGASKQKKRGEPEFWRLFLRTLQLEGASKKIVLACGPGEQEIIRLIDPDNSFLHYIGSDDLRDFWAAVRDAGLMICLDSSAAHIGKLTRTPTICLYGPGGAALTGKSDFFRHLHFTELTFSELPNNQTKSVFARALPVRKGGDILNRDLILLELVNRVKQVSINLEHMAEETLVKLDKRTL